MAIFEQLGLPPIKSHRRRPSKAFGRRTSETASSLGFHRTVPKRPRPLPRFSTWPYSRGGRPAEPTSPAMSALALMWLAPRSIASAEAAAVAFGSKRRPWPRAHRSLGASPSYHRAPHDPCINVVRRRNHAGSD